MPEDKRFFAGVDIGGSTMKAALVDAGGQSTGTFAEVKSLVTEGYQVAFG